eukprot:6599526-Prymnesium_polylepis.1
MVNARAGRLSSPAPPRPRLVLLARAAGLAGGHSASQQAKRSTDNDRRSRERKDIVARPTAPKHDPPGRARRGMRHDRLPVARDGGKP